MIMVAFFGVILIVTLTALIYSDSGNAEEGEKKIPHQSSEQTDKTCSDTGKG